MRGLVQRLLHPARFLRDRLRTWARRRQGTDSDPVTIHRRRTYILPTGVGLMFGLMAFAMLLGIALLVRVGREVIHCQLSSASSAPPSADCSASGFGKTLPRIWPSICSARSGCFFINREAERMMNSKWAMS